MIEFCLPWPPAALSPNSGAKLREKMRAKKAYRNDCYIVALENRAKLKRTYAGDIAVKIEFRFPDGIKRDLDNLHARIKHGLDSIAKSMNVDDCRFNPIIIQRGSITKGGKVIVTIGGGV